MKLSQQNQYRPEVQTLLEGQVICVQGHHAIARKVKIHPERFDAQRITFEGHFLPHPRNEGVINTGYNGGCYSLYSLYIPGPEEAQRLVAGN